MATVGTVSPGRAANAVAWNAASSGGDKWVNGEKDLLIVTNGSASGITLTITTPLTIDGEAVADKVITIGAGTTQLLGPFPGNIYNDSDKLVSLAWSLATTITFIVIRP